MASLDDLVAFLFAALGPVGSLVAIFVVFAIDAAIFPALPEAWIILVYTYPPPGFSSVSWALLLLGMAVVGDVVGTSSLYLFVRRVLVQRERMPGWLGKAMRRWTEFLVLKDERIILMNRIAPVVPFVGAFIATLGWDYRKSMSYVAVGGLAKYSAILYIVFVIGVTYEVGTARWITFGLILAVIALSVVASVALPRRHRKAER